jgi:hypothetical protein
VLRVRRGLLAQVPLLMRQVLQVLLQEQEELEEIHLLAL